ncbi:MAG: hypothetical protein ACJ8AW_10135 [Rhodopila sp.]
MNVLTKPPAAPTGTPTTSTAATPPAATSTPINPTVPAPAPTSGTLAPATFGELVEFAQIAARSQFVPKDYRGHPEDILLAVQLGSEVGLRPLQALQNIAVINGRPAVWGDALPGLCKASAVFEDLIETFEREDDPDFLTAVCVAKRHGSTPVTARFSLQDAKRAGLWTKTGPWQTYPRRMLQMRARSFALRDAFPDVLKGLIAVEEALDLPAPPDRLPSVRTIHAAPEPPLPSPTLRPPEDTSTETPVTPPTPVSPPAAEPPPEPPGDPTHAAVYRLQTKQGVTTFRIGDEWLACWAKIVRGCKAANALDKLQNARDTNAAHIAAVAAFDPAPVDTLNAELDRALAPPSAPP